MSGYVPLFGSLITGTLHGRWPDIGLWPIVLSLADRHGIVDVTHEYIASVTGLPLEDVIACMRRFCEPDPGSRTKVENGARLVLIDPERNWGWRIVNHAKYRERARKQAWDAARTASGRDAERKRQQRQASRRVPTCPVGSPLSNTNTNTDTNIEERVSFGNSLARARASALPDFHRQVIEAYHAACPELPRVKAWTERRRRALDARIAERKREGKPADTIEYWAGFFAQVAASDFLTGRSGDFRADLEWLLRPENFLKVIEGRYTNRRHDGR